MDPRLGVVIATRGRPDGLRTTLGHLLAREEAPAVIVVDNGSAPGVVASVRDAFPAVRFIELAENLGAAARNVGAAACGAPYVAFSDDDSWWAPGSLARAADLFDAHPRLGLLAARVLVGEEGREDPVCAAMAASRVAGPDGLPGPAVLGFLACGAVVRREAFLEAGGFERRYGVGGEEELLAIDLAARGWRLAYVAEVVAVHHPAVGERPGRRRVQRRNALWTAWLRRRWPAVLRATGRAAAEGLGDAEARAALGAALRGLPWVLRRRRAVPAGLERSLRLRDGEPGYRPSMASR